MNEDKSYYPETCGCYEKGDDDFNLCTLIGSTCAVKNGLKCHKRLFYEKVFGITEKEKENEDQRS